MNTPTKRTSGSVTRSPLSAIAPSLRLRIPPLAVTVASAIAGWLAARAFPALSLDLPGRWWLASTFGLLGIATSVLGVASFCRARTTVNPLKPDSATSLVVSGIYRVTRNPMYLGFLFLLLGELAWLANAVTVGSSRVDLQACKLEYSIVSPK